LYLRHNKRFTFELEHESPIRSRENLQTLTLEYKISASHRFMLAVFYCKLKPKIIQDTTTTTTSQIHGTKSVVSSKIQQYALSSNTPSHKEKLK
jgi:hypothetical protein